MAFSRDPWIRRNSQIPPHAPLIARENDEDNNRNNDKNNRQNKEKSNRNPNQHNENVTAIPPCGVQPFRDLVMYAAPLCYLYGDVAEAYFVFRQMWCSYWCRLNSISSKNGGLLCLCKLFECLLQRVEPELCHHLLQISASSAVITYVYTYTYIFLIIK